MENKLPPEQQTAWDDFVRSGYHALKAWHHTSGELVLAFEPSFTPPSYLNVNFSNGAINWDFYYWDPSTDFKRIFETQTEWLRFKFRGAEPSVRHITGIYDGAAWGDTTEKIKSLTLQPYLGPDYEDQGGWADGTTLKLHLNSYYGSTQFSWHEMHLPRMFEPLQPILATLLSIRALAREQAAVEFPGDEIPE